MKKQQVIITTEISNMNIIVEEEKMTIHFFLD